MATGLEGVNERDEKDAKEIEEIKRLREAIRAGIDPKTGRRLTPKGRNRIQRRLGRLERLHHRPKIEISLPTVVRISLDDSWGYDAARPSFDPPSEPDAGGMVQRGLITFPRGIPQGGSGKILLRVDCQAFDLFAPFDVIHLTAKWAGLDVTVGATGPLRVYSGRTLESQSIPFKTKRWAVGSSFFEMAIRLQGFLCCLWMRFPQQPPRRT